MQSDYLNLQFQSSVFLLRISYILRTKQTVIANDIAENAATEQKYKRLLTSSVSIVIDKEVESVLHSKYFHIFNKIFLWNIFKNTLKSLVFTSHFFLLAPNVNVWFGLVKLSETHTKTQHMWKINRERWRLKVSRQASLK